MTLTEVSTPNAARAELHTMVNVQGIMRMRPADSFLIPVGGTLELAPGGKHMMFFDLSRPWSEGGSINLRLDFADGRHLAITLPVLDPESDS